MSRLSNDASAFVRSSQGRSLWPSKTNVAAWTFRPSSVITTLGRGFLLRPLGPGSSAKRARGAAKRTTRASEDFMKHRVMTETRKRESGYSVLGTQYANSAAVHHSG